MIVQFEDATTQGLLRLVRDEARFGRAFFRDRTEKVLTIAWNRGPEQRVVIDEVTYEFPPGSVLPLVVNQSFRFERPESVVAWQFNRNFYCIVNHDREVSCVGFLFYGSAGVPFVRLDAVETRKFEALLDVFEDEFATRDTIQGEMLLMLLKRLIIKVTRLGKLQLARLPEDRLQLVREFNLLVENHYRRQHGVQFYADLLHKSPKTLANVFALYNQQSPLQIIHERVALEAKRLLLYTDQSAKEIAYELGFEEVPHFSRFFKKQTGQAPTEFKETHRMALLTPA
jgi:AraC-like DNA-binding protein